MKYNIRHINYDGTENPNGKWWSWKEKCDRCGANCRSSDIMSMTELDIDAMDYCVECFDILLGMRAKEVFDALALFLLVCEVKEEVREKK